MRIRYRDFISNETLYKMAGVDQEFLAHIKSRKMKYFGHITRKTEDSIEKSVITG